MRLFKNMSARQSNNMLMIICIVFIIILNLPTFIKEYLIDEPVSAYPYVLNPAQQPIEMNFPKFSLDKSSGNWVANTFINISATELAQRWQSLAGTEVTQATYEKLKPQLKSPNTLEIWYIDIEEPQRVTYYQLPEFWLLKSWEEKWIAVTVDPDYLYGKD
jgi:hypothetical protein